MKGPNIPLRRLAEETAVFAIELAGAFVSNLKARTRRVQTIRGQTINEHAAPRRLQPKLFLILKRTHGGQHPEMMVQRGHGTTGYDLTLSIYGTARYVRLPESTSAGISLRRLCEYHWSWSSFWSSTSPRDSDDRRLSLPMVR